jgi:hypothetical protein
MSKSATQRTLNGSNSDGLKTTKPGKTVGHIGVDLASCSLQLSAQLKVGAMH